MVTHRDPLTREGAIGRCSDAVFKSKTLFVPISPSQQENPGTKGRAWYSAHRADSHRETGPAGVWVHVTFQQKRGVHAARRLTPPPNVNRPFFGWWTTSSAPLPHARPALLERAGGHHRRGMPRNPAMHSSDTREEGCAVAQTRATGEWRASAGSDRRWGFFFCPTSAQPQR